MAAVLTVLIMISNPAPQMLLETAAFMTKEQCDAARIERGSKLMKLKLKEKEAGIEFHAECTLLKVVE